ncbi:pheromone/general odorant binding protein, partial [Klebsiella pneumoniae]|nr:pheromone/general odorant binding protein [Klebsiella pneumoniae]
LLNDDGTYNKTGMGEGLKKYWPEWPLDKIELINNKCHDEDALKGFRSMSIPKSQAEKCMMGCLMRKVNVINNGKFSVEEASKIAQKYYGT